MDVQFSDIEEEFLKRIAKTVWCTMATVDRNGRPRSRIIHPIWEGSTGWILTGRNTLKTKHLEGTPYVSLTYWDPGHKQVYADCKASWEDDIETKQRVWDLYKSAPPPLGYDPAMFFDSADSPETGALRLKPWRIELFSLTDLASGSEPKVWRG